MNNSYEKCYRGEREARRYLEREGYVILAQNYYTPYGGVNIIACKDCFLVFVEIKVWSSISPEFLISSIIQSRKSRFFQSSRVFLKEYPEYEGFKARFDVIFVKGKKITSYSSSLEANDIEL